MADQMSGPITRCPWCSAELQTPDPERCPSCGATLASVSGTEPVLPGVTALDPEAIGRARFGATGSRSRILSFLTGDVSSSAGTDEPTGSAPFAPPSDEVRREMLRLQIEAERADLVAETVALKADVLAQRGIHVSELGKVSAASDGEPAPDSESAASDGEPAPGGEPGDEHRD
jgi:hypothetical protein